MVQLTTIEFGKYLEEDVRYIYNQKLDIAYRDTTEDGTTRLFSKGRGQSEKEIDILDKDFKEAVLYKTVMTKEEYDEF